METTFRNGFDGNCFGSSSNLNGDGSKDVPDRRFSPPRSPRPIYDPTSLNYDMKGNKLMFIFNHDIFQNFEYDLPPRPGTEYDVERLQDSFGKLEFIVDEPCNNFTHYEILVKLKDICEMDHSYTSCVAIVILTHGAKGGVVCASDKPYPVSDVINYVLNEPSLAGKPKLFFIQACRGENTDAGHRVEIDGRSVVSIPTHSDFLALMATYEEFVSFRNERGSWMIQALCDIVDEHHEDLDVLHMMLLVNNKVAKRVSLSNKIPLYNNKKQILEIRFTLTKFLRFNLSTD